MTAKRQLNLRLSAPGWAKLEELTRQYGSQTISIEVAIDRLYRQEQEVTMTDHVVGNRDRCGRCGTRHGGNNHHCPVHGAVSEGCCVTPCNPDEWAWVTESNGRSALVAIAGRDLGRYCELARPGNWAPRRFQAQ